MMENQLTDEVRALVNDVEQTHKYSMSKIYGLYNQVFQTKEVPQACASCLIRKVKALKEWLNKQDTVIEEEKVEIAEKSKKRKSRSKKTA